MAFHEQISNLTAADVMAALPGIPRSTAYDWLAGTRWPAVYLQPVVLAHLRSTKKSQNKTVIRTNASRASTEVKRKR